MIFLYNAVRRGLEHPAAAHLIQRGTQDGEVLQVPQVPQWGLTILSITAVVFLFFIMAVDYTLENVIATLAMVETPSSSITIAPASEHRTPDEESKQGLLETGPSVTLVPQKPITSSIRGTVRHLVSQAGRLSRWRGFGTLVMYEFAFNIVASFIDKLTPWAIPGRLVFITGLTGALLANLHASWTHKVVAMPTQKGIWQRMLPRSEWKVLALPAALQTSAKYVTFYIFQGLAIIFQIPTQGEPHTKAEFISLVLRIMAILVLSLFFAFFLWLPAFVTLVRVESSLLPEDQETIVPFDRTFGGKVVPKVLGGTGCVGFVDAWKSFDWEGRRRVIKLFAKIFAITTAIFVVFVHVILFELWAIMGSALPKAISDANRALDNI